MKILCVLMAAGALTLPGVLRAADGGEIKGMSIEPATTKVAIIGKARLSVEPLTKGDEGLQAPYKVDVSGLPAKGEQGRFTVKITEADIHKIEAGQAVNFGGQAVSDDGNTSNVRGTATPTSGDEGNIKIKVESKKGKLVFNTKYRLTR